MLKNAIGWLLTILKSSQITGNMGINQNSFIVFLNGSKSPQNIKYQLKQVLSFFNRKVVLNLSRF